MAAPALAPRREPARRAPARRAPARRKPARKTTARKTTARKTTARKATARKAAPRRKPRPNRALASGSRSQGIAQPALAGAALIPLAAVSAAGAVRDLSDSSLIVRLTAGRGWIAVLCALLGGIVALNVVSLSINATSGRVGLAIEEYERRNSALRAELAQELSAGRVEDGAAALGLAVPAPDDVSYLRSRAGDFDRLAALLAGDTVLSYEDSSVDPTPPPSIEAAPPVTSSPPPAAAPPVTAPPASAPPASAPPTAAPPSAGASPTGGVGL
jgi:hypothetical protein